MTTQVLPVVEVGGAPAPTRPVVEVGGAPAPTRPVVEGGGAPAPTRETPGVEQGGGHCEWGGAGVSWLLAGARRTSTTGWTEDDA